VVESSAFTLDLFFTFVDSIGRIHTNYQQESMAEVVRPADGVITPWCRGASSD
jgi:hypothetical protein